MQRGVSVSMEVIYFLVVARSGSIHTCDHAIPADGEKNDGHISDISVWVEQAEELYDEAE